MLLLFWLLTGQHVTWLDAAISVMNLALALLLLWLFLRARAHARERGGLYRVIAKQAEHARSLSRIAAFALEIENLNEYADLVCRKIGRQLQMPIVGIFAANDRQIQLYAGTGWSDGLVGCVDQPRDRDTHIGYTVIVNETVSFHDLAHDLRFSGPRFLRDHGIVSGCGAVIPSGVAGKPWGVLAVYDLEPHRLSAEEISYLESAARIFGGALSLRASQHRYRLLSESGNDIVLTTNLGGRVTWIAPSCQRLLGYTADELLAMARFAILHPDDYPAIKPIIETPRPVDSVARVRLKPKNGEWRWIDFRFSPLFEGETFVGLRGMGRDVSAEVEAQLVQEHLFSMTAHELRTPLSVLKGYAQIIQRGRLEPGQVMDYAQKIVHGVDEVSDLIDGMLEIDPSGRANQRLESLELCQIVTSEIARFESYHPDQVGRFDVERPRGNVIGVWDRGRVGRAIFNLLENAAKYSTDRIQVVISADGAHAYVDVTDHGMGIALEEVEKIFQPYFRSQRNEARNASGMGLGLTIADAAVKLHGGAITVDSHIGQGTTMTISLPFNPPS